MKQPLLLQTMQLNPDPDVIDLGAGQPEAALLPLDLMRRAAHIRLAQDDTSLLQYGAEQGDGYFRVALAGLLSAGYGIPVEPDNLFITCGASQGLDLLTTLLARSEDTVLVEEPSYFLALRILADHRCHVVGVPMDAGGVDLDALQELAKQHRPKFFYTIPTYQNPTGITLDSKRRRRLADLSRELDFTVVADEVYHLLSFDTPPPPPLGSYCEDGYVISLGSFSKILAPGLRLGWIQASHEMIERLTRCGLLDSSGGLNPFTSALVRVVIEEGWQQQHIERLRAVYRYRAAAMGRALRQELDGVARFDEPQGGYFYWLRLAEQVDTLALEAAATQYKVGYRAGVRFSSGAGLRNCLRISFAYYDIPELEEGVARLARLLKSNAAAALAASKK